MVTVRPAPLVSRLESVVTHAIRGHEGVTLAFSGGLASSLLAAVARKRCTLRCLVVGIDEAPDLQAARLAQDFLDVRLETLRPSALEILRWARSIAQAAPTLRPSEVASLVPLTAVLARPQAKPVLAGFGPVPLPLAARRYLRKVDAVLPFQGVGMRAIARATLRAAARVLGLPEAFVRSRRRPPGEGSGVWSVLRSLATHRGTTVAMLLREPDYP